MSDLHKATIAIWLGGVRFWVPVFLVLMMSRGFDEAVVLQMTSAFYLLTVVLEYPTGVISDRFSHRLSVGIGLILLALGTLGYTVIGTLAGYVTVMVILAIGTTFVSGSDKAIISMVTKKFGASLATMQVGSAIVGALSALAGGAMALYDLAYPLYATAACNVVGALLIFSVRSNGVHLRPQTIRQIVAGSVGTLRDRPIMRHALTISLLAGAFAYGVKWLYNPLFLETYLAEVWWGTATACATAAIAAGALLYRVYDRVDFVVLGTVLTLGIAAIGMTWWPMVAFGGLFASHIARGYLETKTAALINSVASEDVIASTFSLDTLFTRIGAAGFTSAAGIMLAGWGLWSIMTTTALLIVAAGGYAFVCAARYDRR